MKRLLPLITICLVTLIPSLEIEAQTFTSIASGDWTNVNTWDQDDIPGDGDDVVISAGDNVTIPVGGNVGCNNLQIDVGGSITGGTLLRIGGDLLINGSISGVFTVSTTKTNGIIDGQGNITVGNVFLVSNDHSIPNTANLTVNGNIQVNDASAGGGSADLTNNGNLTVNGNIVVVFGNESFFNNDNAVLNISGSLLPANGGTLNTSGVENLVNYTSANPATVRAPDVGNYQNLEFSGGSTYTLPANLTIDQSLTVTSGTFNTGNFDLTLNGDFSNSGTFTPGTSTVTFGGTADQTVTLGAATSIETLVLNNSVGNIVFDNNVTVTNTLNMTSGNVNMSGNTLTLGTGTGNAGTLLFTAGSIIGSFERWIASTGTFTFPIGVANNARTVALEVVVAGTSGSVIALFDESSPGNAGLPFTDGVVLTNVFPNGYWQLSTSNGFSAASYNLDLTGDGFRSSPGVDAATRLIVRGDAVSDWGAEGNHVDATGTTVQRNALSAAFPRQYAFGDDTECPVPVPVVIAGSSDVCTGSTEGYNVETPTVGSIYNWTITGGTIVGTNPASNNISGLDLSAIQVNWGGTGQVGNVTVAETTLCSTEDPVSLEVNVNSIAPTEIIGETEVPDNITGYTYSVALQANYTYFWTITGGTVSGTNPSSNTISGLGLNSIQVDWGSAGAGKVNVVAQRTGCTVAPAVEIDVTIYGTFTPKQDGLWSTAATWNGDAVPGPTNNVRINGFAVTVNAETTINNLVIDLNQTLDVNANFNVTNILDVDGDLNVDGVLTSNGNTLVNGQIAISGTNDINIAGGATSPVNTLSGTGTISIANGSINIQTANKEIPTGTELNLSNGGIDIADNLTVTNNGDITIDDNLDGGSGSSWVNAQNSRLTLNAEVFPTVNGGSLSASATGNTVEYTGVAESEIIAPVDSYYNLEINAALSKIVGANLNIDGDLNLVSGNFDVDDPTGFTINLAGNWNHTGSGSFLSDGSTIIFDGNADQTIVRIPVGAEVFDKVELNKPGGSLILDNASNTTIQIGSGRGTGSSLTLTSGILQVPQSTSITLIDEATVNEGNANSYIDGPISATGSQDRTYPVGDGNIWAPVRVEGTNAALGDVATVQYFDAAFSNTVDFGASGLNNVSTVEYWDIDVVPINSLTYEASLTFFWKDVDRSGIDNATDLRIAHWNGSTWDVLDPSVAPTLGPEGSITIPGVTNFSPFTFGSLDAGSNPLPVDLLSFEAKLVENQVILTWITTSEVNNDFFEVQRSEDGEDWEVIGTVDGNGTINEEITYSFTDSRPFFGKSFYRLRQVDFDGQFEYLKVAGVDNPFIGAAMEIMVFPNPTEAGNINLRVLTGNKENKISVQLIDALGHRFIEETRAPEVFTEDLMISPRSGLAKGVYFLIVTQNKESIRQRVIIN